MTFKHKLSVRLALLKDAWLVVALAALGCEKPVALTDSTATIRLQITPKSVTLPPGGATRLTAVAFTPVGDTANIHVNWTVSGGSIADTSTNGGRHYAGYQATPDAGVFRVVASGPAATPDTATVTVVGARVAAVKVIPAVVSLLVGAAVQLTATTTDSAGNLLSGRSISWSSSDAAVASVNSSGLVTSVAQGSATITATSEGQSAAVPVTVTSVPVASLQICPASANVFVGQTLPLTATTKDSAGNTLTGRPVAWASSNPSVVTVSSSGQVAGVTQGSVAITATSESKTATATINVAIVPVASVRVSPASASLPVGQTLQLTATPQDSAGNALTARPVTWTSSNPSVATVSTSGRVTGGTAGSATITATSEGKTGSATVTVTLAPVASVAVSPATTTVPAKGTVQLSVTLKDANGSTLTGRTVAWTSSAPTIATVSSSGLVTDVADAGTVTITATSEGKSGTSAVTVQAPSPTGAVPDPTLLPVAALQVPNVAAYAALNVPSRPAGFSYNDPVTGVRVWKVTSSSTPTGNSGARHDYGERGKQARRGLAVNNNTTTMLMRGDRLAFYLVDFIRGTGFSNYRVLTVQPRRDLCASFSSVAGSERILYIHTGSQLIRYNTHTMQPENTGRFPMTGTIYSWLHQDRNDAWFTGLLDDNQTVWAWNSQTGQYLTHNESWTNEPRMERNGRYVVITSGGTPTTVRVWDLATNSFGPVQTTNYFSHLASLRGRWVGVDNNATAPPPLDRYQVVGGSLTRTARIFGNSGGYETNNSGNWIQTDDDRQWAYISGVDESSFTNLLRSEERRVG